MSLDLQKKEVRVNWRYPHAQAKVWKAISQGFLLMTCGSRASKFEHDFRVGGTYQYSWWPEQAPAEPANVCSGEYLDIQPEHRVRFSWSEPNAPHSEVLVTLKTRGAFTLIDLVHSGVTDVDRMHDYHQGWTEVLALFNDDLDGTTLRLSQDYEAAASTVFRALAEGALFQMAGGEKGGTNDFREGGAFDFKIGSADYIRGTFKRIVKDEAIRFTWCTLDCGETITDTDVAVYLKPLGPKKARVWLIHDGLTKDAVRASHTAGWKDALQQLSQKVVD